MRCMCAAAAGEGALTWIGSRGRAASYAELRRRARAEGLFERRPWRDALRLAITLLVLGLVFAALPHLRETGSFLIGGIVAAFLAAQVAFLVHDAAHGQLARSRNANEALALVLTCLLLGASVGWWRKKHDSHHAHPNDVARDPDARISILSFSAREARARAGFARWVAKWQAFLFTPLLLLEAVHLKVNSLIVIVHGGARHPVVEPVLMTLHYLAFCGAPFCILSAANAVTFLVSFHGALGLYLGLVFAPNHMGMPEAGDWVPGDFLRAQITTTRSVRGSRLLDFLFGGLNHHIEHHLFPSMPRHQLRRAGGLVRVFCEERELRFHQPGLLEAYREVFVHLHSVGVTLRREGR
jgi:fatty acid desaturase